MPTISELIALVAAVPPIEASTPEDGAGTEHDVLHQLELDAAAALLGFADAAAPVLVGLDAAVGELQGDVTALGVAAADLDTRVDALEAAGPGGAGVRDIGAGFDGGSVDGAPESVRVGMTALRRVATAREWVSWTLLMQGATGDVTVAVRRKPFASGSFTDITGGSPPSGSSGANAEGDASGWTALDAGDLLQFEITARTGLVPWVSLAITWNEV